MTALRWTAVACMALAGILANPTRVLACTCAVVRAAPEDKAGEAALVAVGDVVAVGSPIRTQSAGDRVSIDIAITWIAKGSGQVRRVRVWHHLDGNGCSPGLSNVSVGDRLAFAVLRASDERKAKQARWEELNITPSDSDYVLMSGPCYSALALIQTDEDAARWAGRTFK